MIHAQKILASSFCANYCIMRICVNPDAVWQQFRTDATIFAEGKDVGVKIRDDAGGIEAVVIIVEEAEESGFAKSPRTQHEQVFFRQRFQQFNLARFIGVKK